MTQLDLFTAPPDTTLTVADIDDWIADTRAMTHPHIATHRPHEWARVALGELLGEDIPARRWPIRELLDMLTRARAALASTEEESHA